ncbi:MAG: hypothetical protein PHT88_03665 [Candidatus Moranbacteria bacterium]|nr:hypothetical protein [Candidatus Moranbacteria bacterium]
METIQSNQPIQPIKPTTILDLPIQPIEGSYNKGVVCSDGVWIETEGMHQRFFGPYPTPEEANRKNISIDDGIAARKGYYIILPVGTKAETICKCMGEFEPCYFYLKKDITQADVADQSRFSHGGTHEKRHVVKVANKKNSLIVGYCCKSACHISLDNQYVQYVDTLNDRWSFEYTSVLLNKSL